MNIEGILYVVCRHGRAFDMPPRAPFAPGALPGGFTLFFLFPEGKIKGITLLFTRFNPGPGHQLVLLLMGQPAVIRKAGCIIVNISATGVGNAVFQQPPDQFNNLGDMPGSSRFDIGRPHMQGGSIFFIGFYKLFGQFSHGDPLFASPVNHFVVNICIILDQPDRKAAVFEIAPDHIENNKDPGIADMNIVVDCGATDVKGNQGRRSRFQFLFAASEGVIDFYGHNCTLRFRVLSAGSEADRSVPAGSVRPRQPGRAYRCD